MCASRLTDGAPAAPDPAELDALAPRVLALVRRVADELRPGAPLAAALGLDDALERDYGLDSLARVELLARIERELDAALGEPGLSDAETPRDLVRLVALARRAALGSPRPLAPPAGAGARPAPVDATPPDAIATLPAVFDWQLRRDPQRVLLTLLGDGDSADPLRLADLEREAAAVAAGLAALGLRPGDRVAIMLPTGREFFAAFFAALLWGWVPVPLYPPARPAQLEEHLKRIAGILRNSGAGVLVTVERARPLARLLRAQLPALRAVATVDELSRAGMPGPRPAGTATELAFLQYTSGSTGDPKGVKLTHANLLANLRAMWRAASVTRDDTFVSWLPLYHDMGLIGACLGALVFGFGLVLMSPLAFLARPVRWLEAIHRYRGSLSAAPNFAYELCLARVGDAELAALDLSCWRLAFNGAEPVSADTLERFAARFARCGFAREALMPVYGLAENTLGLAFPPPGRGPLIDRIERAALARDGLARPARAGDAQPLRVVSCGMVLPGHELRIVDARSREQPEREQGRVQFRGPSATAGYFDNPAADRRLFDGDWLVSGDLGYLAGGELFLTGREKDIVIRGGFNIHPQELETAAAGIAGIRRGGVAVFAASDARSGTERLVVLAETGLRDAAQREGLRRAITALSATLLGAPADDVVLAPPRTVLKTSSGKIRRAACRALYEQGRLGAAPRPVWLQWLRLAAAAGSATAHRAALTLGQQAWALRAWAAVAACGTLAWVAIMLLPTLAQRRRVAHALARAALRLTGLSLQADGLDRLDATAACIVVANHASYADAILLEALLPPVFGFAAKRELADAPLIGAALRRLGVVFVERAQAAQGAEDTRALQARLRAGDSLVFFPEGTLRRAAGLQPFRLGAFVVAAETGVPLVPVTLNGTRSLLRDGSWLPRHGGLRITVGPTIAPAGPGWDSAIALRDAARRAIAVPLDEPVVET